MERKNYIIIGLGLLLVGMTIWLIKATTNVIPVKSKTPEVIITETKRIDTVVKLGNTIIKKVPMVQTITIDNTDTIKIRSLLAQVDSLEKSLIIAKVENKLSIDTICGADRDTVSLVVNVYRKQLDSLSIRKKPIILSNTIEYKYIQRNSTDLWLSVGVGVVGTALLFLIFGGK